MKKLALILTIISSLPMVPAAAGAVDIPLRVVVNGNKIDFPDAKPFIDSNNRTQIPVSFIAKELGASVNWYSGEKQAVFTKGDKKMVIYIGKIEYELNGQKKKMDTTAVLRDNRTFVPVAYVAEAFGATITWESDIKTVYIDIKKDTTGSGETESIAGFTVPKDTGYLLVHVPSDKDVELRMIISATVEEHIPQQIDDMAAILSQKCDKSTVDAVVAHVKQKKTRRDYLAEKYIFDQKSQRCIWIKESRSFSISINYLTSELSKLYKNKGA